MYIVKQTSDDTEQKNQLGDNMIDSTSNSQNFHYKQSMADSEENSY